MVKTNQFSAKVSYVSPSCKAVPMHGTRNICLVGSYDKKSGISTIDDVTDGGENDHSTNWGW